MIKKDIQVFFVIFQSKQNFVANEVIKILNNQVNQTITNVSNSSVFNISRAVLDHSANRLEAFGSY